MHGHMNVKYGSNVNHRNNGCIVSKQVIIPKYPFRYSERQWQHIRNISMDFNVLVLFPNVLVVF